ncbi:MAG TPA: carboxypeptidase-like regulatory domain-containing protein, partial [Candidatus Binatia bacterium]|nr:carboxypeptidase-like regulatory domain-containing protein [Candidatus Binatia bacterium]
MAGAKVTLTNDATGVALASTTNPEGLYEYASVPVGTYTIQVEQPGFKRLRQDNLNVAIARRLNLDLALEVGDTQQTVQVTSQAPILDTATSEIGTNFAPKFMT